MVTDGKRNPINYILNPRQIRKVKDLLEDIATRKNK
jgi:hypothetical protein